MRVREVSLETASEPSQCNVMERHREQWLVRVSITANQVTVYRERSKGGGFNCLRIEVWNCCHSRIKKEREVAAMKPGCIAWNWSFLHLHRDIPSAGGELILMPRAVLSCMPMWTRKNPEPIWKKLEAVYEREEFPDWQWRRVHALRLLNLRGTSETVVLCFQSWLHFKKKNYRYQSPTPDLLYHTLWRLESQNMYMRLFCYGGF